jgi:hypothetical protein
MRGENIVQAPTSSNLNAKPTFCRPINNKERGKPCSTCTTTPNYPIEHILDPVAGIAQTNLRNELKLHHHPTMRELGKNSDGKAIWVTTQQQKRELADHYIYQHNCQEPDII